MLVTGATSGIGRVAALELARLGADVVIIARNPERGEAALAEFEGGGSGKAELIVCDLAAQRSIRAAAAEFLDRFDQLHVLINNAGVLHGRRMITGDGLEATFAVNHMAYFLLTWLLLPVMEKSAPARIVNVSSAAHKRGHIDFDDLQAEKRYGQFRAYAQSKLANIVFTRELARRVEATGITVNAAHSGMVRTGFGRDASPLVRAIAPLLRPFMASPEQGAQTAIYLATSARVEGVTGEYFIGQNPARSSQESRDPEVARRLWQVSCALAGLDPGAARSQ